jgi:hypothetical protein
VNFNARNQTLGVLPEVLVTVSLRGRERPGANQRALTPRHGDSYHSGEPTTRMSAYEASFEIDSKPDSYAARRVLEGVYDTIREESQSVREG